MNVRKILIYLIVILMLIFTMQACKTPSAPAKGAITGTITLDGETDHSGIVVSVFAAGLVPDELRLIQQNHPQLAFPIDDKEIFDHRDQVALQTVFTSDSGRFSFDSLPYGDYNMAYRKEGWGYNYYFGLVLNSAEMDINPTTQMNLYPEIVLPNYVNGEYQLESNRCYVAIGDVFLGLNAEIFFRDDARLLLSPNVKIISQASIVTPEYPSRAYVTSYAGIHNGSIRESEMGEGLSHLKDSLVFRDITFSFLRNALKVTGNGHSMERLSFRGCVSGLLMDMASEVLIQNCFFYRNDSLYASAHQSYNVQGYLAINNIYFNNYLALKHQTVTEALVANNAFLNNEFSFVNAYDSTAEFKFNYISSNGVGVDNSGRSNLFLSSNQITARICVRTSNTPHWLNTVHIGWTKANMNNFIAHNSTVVSNAIYYDSGNPVILDFKNNYWGTTSYEAIESSIIDYHDHPPYDTSNGGNWAIVEYLPYRQSPVLNAGIQPH